VDEHSFYLAEVCVGNRLETNKPKTSRFQARENHIHFPGVWVSRIAFGAGMQLNQKLSYLGSAPVYGFEKSPLEALHINLEIVDVSVMQLLHNGGKGFHREWSRVGVFAAKAVLVVIAIVRMLALSSLSYCWVKRVDLAARCDLPHSLFKRKLIVGAHRVDNARLGIELAHSVVVSVSSARSGNVVETA
jgi:hypothetical protein